MCNTRLDHIRSSNRHHVTSHSSRVTHLVARLELLAVERELVEHFEREVLERTEQPIYELRRPTERQLGRHVSPVVQQSNEVPRPITTGACVQLEHHTGAVRRPPVVENAERLCRGRQRLVVSREDHQVGGSPPSPIRWHVEKPLCDFTQQGIGEELRWKRPEVVNGRVGRGWRRRRGIGDRRSRWTKTLLGVCHVATLVVVVGQRPHPLDCLPRDAAIVGTAG